MNNQDNQKGIVMPVRVELSHLMVIDGDYFLNHRLFTGLAYDHRDNQLYKVYQITEGQISGEQEYGFFHRAGFVKLDFSVIEDYFEAGEQTIYQGKPFNGITNEYRDGFVWGELLWVDGYHVESIGWYPDGSGLIQDYQNDYDEYRCRFEWHYKQLISATVTKNPFSDRVSFSLTLNEHNKIKSCVLRGDNIANLGQLVTRTDLPVPATLTELLACYRVAETIKLNINNAINFNYFIAHTDFNSIKTLEFKTENLALTTLAPIMDLPDLQSIYCHEAGLTDYDLHSMDEKERLIKQQQCDERNHALLDFLFALQAKRHCNIRLNADSGFMLIYRYAADDGSKVIADVNQADLTYLLNRLPQEQIVELELRQTYLPIASLQKLAKLRHLKQLTVEEDKIYDPNEATLAEEVKMNIQRQDELRYRLLWALLVDLQSQLHCDIKLITKTLEKFEQRYQS